MSLDNRVAIVTGGGGGIGGAIARHFARQGAKIAVADIHPESAKLRTAEITGQGGNAFTVVVDVTNKKSVQEMVRSTSTWKSRTGIIS
jgi:NAD(P)-dependent dehydrogenase (short-subunit alcohol dehydrogenase family)